MHDNENNDNWLIRCRIGAPIYNYYGWRKSYFSPTTRAEVFIQAANKHIHFMCLASRLRSHHSPCVESERMEEWWAKSTEIPSRSLRVDAGGADVMEPEAEQQQQRQQQWERRESWEFLAVEIHVKLRVHSRCRECGTWPAYSCAAPLFLTNKHTEI